MQKIKKYISIVFLAISMAFFSVTTSAQCPMCKMAAESNLKMGGSAGKGLNRGILFMLAMPYVIVGSLGYMWLKNRKKEDDPDFPV